MRLRTQWRVGISGPTGLDHNVLFALMDRQQLDYPRQDLLAGQVLLIEQGALQEMRRQSE